MQADSNSSEVVIDDFEVLVKDTIKHITSSTISESRKILLITTAKGFVLCDLAKMQYARYTFVEVGSKINNPPSMWNQMETMHMGASLGLSYNLGRRWRSCLALNLIVSTPHRSTSMVQRG